MPEIEQPDIDKELLNECMTLLEIATFHDGRYSQMENPKWQSKAQKLVRKLGEKVGRKPYAGFN